jgi:hypothetical protein
MATRDRKLRTLPGLVVAPVLLLVLAAVALALAALLAADPGPSVAGLVAAGVVDPPGGPPRARYSAPGPAAPKAAMVSNLMVVLVSDRGAQPVVNSGSLYT